MNRRMRKPLASLLISAATVAALALPAGAAASKDWTVQTIPCATGHKSAVIGSSPTHPYWLRTDPDGGGTRNPHAWLSWFKNPCKGQWLGFNVWEGDPSEDSNTYWSAAPGTSGRIGGATSARLLDGPYCPTDVGFDFGTIVRNGESHPC
ncbi:MAG: hypothetical protein QOF96_3988 [Actinomycetota bacterium]|nr:hypothetical protein [Actinomycetota bacterium]